VQAAQREEGQGFGAGGMEFAGVVEGLLEAVLSLRQIAAHEIGIAQVEQGASGEELKAVAAREFRGLGGLAGGGGGTAILVLDVADLEEGLDLLLWAAGGAGHCEGLVEKRASLLEIPALVGHHAALVQNRDDAFGVAESLVQRLGPGEIGFGIGEALSAAVEYAKVKESRGVLRRAAGRLEEAGAGLAGAAGLFTGAAEVEVDRGLFALRRAAEKRAVDRDGAGGVYFPAGMSAAAKATPKQPAGKAPASGKKPLPCRSSLKPAFLASLKDGLTKRTSPKL